MASAEESKHQGAENSPLKNRAPSSLTTFNTSESTSILDIFAHLGVCAKHPERWIKYSDFRWPHNGHG
jgi:hypothetical protein